MTHTDILKRRPYIGSQMITESNTYKYQLILPYPEREQVWNGIKSLFPNMLRLKSSGSTTLNFSPEPAYSWDESLAIMACAVLLFSPDSLEWIEDYCSSVDKIQHFESMLDIIKWQHSLKGEVDIGKYHSLWEYSLSMYMLQELSYDLADFSEEPSQFKV